MAKGSSKPTIKPAGKVVGVSRLLGEIRTDDPLSATANAIKRLHAHGGRPFTDAEAIEFMKRPVGLGLRIEPRAKGRGRPAKLSPTEEAYRDHFNRWRGLWHKLIRLGQNRTQAAQTRRRAGKLSREAIEDLIVVALYQKTPKRRVRNAVKLAAAARGITIPGERQLSNLIAAFFKSR